VRDTLLVALGGALGSVLRWTASSRGWWRLSRDLAFPWATLAVNLVGSLLIGFLLGLTLARFPVSVPARLFLVTGVLGGFTTFSAFSWEAIELVRSGQPWAAAGYVAASVAGGLLAAWLGVGLASLAGAMLATRA
jgi:CrcB protein